MRFDLTYASYRVLERASKRYLPMSPSEISAAKLLIALFEEEECRAADWLSQAGLSLKKFFIDFELYDLADELNKVIESGTAQLQSPISAPGFAAGSYGVPPEVYQGGPYGPMGRRIETDSMQDNYYSSGNIPGRPGDGEEESEEEENSEQKNSSPQQNALRPPPQEPDDWTALESPTVQRYYSVYPGYNPQSYISNTQTQARFYLDDQTVHLGRLSKELESALEVVAIQFGKRTEDRKRIPAFDGGITTIMTRNAEFMASAHPLATEHLLLAAAYDEHDIGAWLRQAGFDPAMLHRRIEELEACKESPSESEPVISAASFDLDDLEPAPPTTTKDFGPILNSIQDQNTLHFASVNSQKIYRLIDAAANRAREAMRVLEDFVRFLLDDSDKTRQLKEFRHEFQEILAPFCFRQRLLARNTDQDVGTAVEGAGEYRRQSPQDVLAANFARLQESLRSLEEFSKLEEPALARKFERLRYQSYTLHKNFCLAQTKNDGKELISTPEISSDSIEEGNEVEQTVVDFPDQTVAAIRNRHGEPPYKRELLENSKLYVLLDCRKDEEDFKQIVQQLIDGGVDIIQLRDKQADDRTLLARSRILRELVGSDRKILFIMNDRPDLARLAGADGVHVGQDELSVADVRTIVGENVFVGVSTHDIRQARQAVLDGADYIGAGPVFESSTKNVLELYDRLPGLDFLREVSEDVMIPAFAIGGISLENLSDVLDCGIGRIAVSAAVLQANDPRQVAKDFFEQLRPIPEDLKTER